ncbi:chemotaxis protein [Clostridium cylindrosporum]|uniref:Stage 0 sporulation protein A homolog n=1 Tax=Clostridium cylindrosporum DSM 605 TaxID=1121307 RepID=A0A0J8DBG0_CLOCY|nr:chemotaxis protein [Clostridium cylindrosporum]KMT23177.1 chemotaxis protein CheV [Clostridium cylindrosporum DSM 605]
MQSKILLESGTGEVEILEFKINNQFYAINVIKTKEVVLLDKITSIPDSSPEIAGLMICRDEVLSLIDLNYVVNGHYNEKPQAKVIICEFNRVKVAFIVDDVIAIHRIPWSKITRPDDISANSLVIGNIMLERKVIQLLDFEKIVTDINPSTGISEDRIVNVEYKDRSNYRIVLADDSALIRKLLKNTLTKAGFSNLVMFDDGQQALDYLISLANEYGENFKEKVQVLITDVEMPQLDGHTLTRKVKEHDILRKLPVIIFSSLITQDLKHKGEAVGADAQLSKPDISTLVNVIDDLIECR